MMMTKLNNWTLRGAFGDARKCKSVCQAESYCCMFAMSGKLNLSLLNHNCISVTCCCGDASRGERSSGGRQAAEFQ